MPTLYRAVAVAAMLALVALGTLAAAPAKPPCTVPENLSAPTWTLPTVRARVAAKMPVRVVVVGTASSTGEGLSAPAAVYVERMAAYLRERIPGLTVEIVNRSKRGWSTLDMVPALDDILRSDRPTLVIWQTGTVEAVRGTDVNDMGDALLAGVAKLRKGGTDVILMDPQYSPRTAAMVNFVPYLDYMVWVSQSTDAELFRRFELMRHWVDEGAIAFDETGRKSQQQMADRAHECIGKAFAAMLVEAIGPEPR